MTEERRGLRQKGAEGVKSEEGVDSATLKTQLHSRVLNEMATRPEWGRQQVRERVMQIIDTELAVKRPKLRRGHERETLIEALLDDIFGLGAIQGLVDDPTVSEIMVNGPFHIFVERDGRIYDTDVKFDSQERLMSTIERIVGAVGRRVDESVPMADARLEDGSRVNIVLGPLVVDGPVLTIRKFARKWLGPKEMVEIDSASQEEMTFLEAAVRGRQNILVTGGTSSGKTTLLNLLSEFIGPRDRVVTIEDARELELRQPHVVAMETRPPNVEGKGKITIRDLVRNTLRMRPDRIVVGEVRGAEALDMIQAMSTDHDGGLSTLHANSTQDALQRLEIMAMMAEEALPSEALRFQIASAIQLVVHTERVSGGKRKIVDVAEVAREKGELLVRSIFFYKQTGVDSEGNAVGKHLATGVVPSVVERIRERGIEVDEKIFKPTSAKAARGALAKLVPPVKE